MPADKQRRATIHDVARAAGVSAATVSKVLRGVASVKPANAQRIRKAIEMLDYRKDPLASGLRNDQRWIIGAVVPDLESPFFGALIASLEQAAERAGYTMIVASSRECEAREADLVARMNDWRVAGTVLMPVRSERGLGADKLREYGMRAVLVDRVSADDAFDTVAADNYRASAEVADFLIGAGHRHVLLHGAVRASKSVRIRVEGFTDRARALCSATRLDHLVSDGDLASQRKAIRDYFETCGKDGLPSAVFSLSQHSTLISLSELRRRGIRVPEDAVLVGFDDAEWMQITWPTITAVAQPVASIAERAVAALLGRVEGKNTGFPAQYLERCTMIVRASARPGIDQSRHSLIGT